MLTPTTYRLLRGGRVQYFFWAFVFGGWGVFLLTGLFTDQARSLGHGWPVYVFVGLVIVLWLGFAGYCALRAFKSTSRVVVDDEGFSYEGVLKTLWFQWKNITVLRWVNDRGAFEWLEITVKCADKNECRMKLDFTGLQPDRLAFTNQARVLAPWATTKLY